MPFRFTQEDFERYVKMDEHGGRHIWHDLQDWLQRILAVPFTNNPYVARGDRLEMLWIVPQETPRSDWSHQAAFYLARNLKGKHLTFGLNVECPSFQWAEEEGADTDRDGVRLIQRLESNQDFRAKIDQLASSSQWKVGMSTQGVAKRARSSEELLNALVQIPEQQYWTAYIYQKMGAEEAIVAGEGIVDVIIAAYKAVLPVWFAIILQADRAFIRQKRRQAVNVWWVNQGESYEYAIPGGFLWAPLENKQGQSLIHWQLLDDVRPRDVVVHYYQQAVRGLSQAQSGPQVEVNPHAESGPQQREGRRVNVEYFEFDDPIPFDDVREGLLPLAIENAPFTELGEVKQGYFWRFNQDGLAVLREAYEGRWPSWTDIALPIQPLGADEPPDVQPPTPVDLRSVLKSALSARALQYSDWQIATFYTALQTKGFVILSGISGTGKTKLAQAFAEILPQPTRPELAMRDDLISITVQPYMPKYNRIIIPKHFTKLYEPPPRGKSKEVQLDFDGNSQTCRLVYHEYANTNYIALYLRGQAAPWFGESFQVDDTVVLEPRSDEDGRLIGFRIGKPSDAQFRRQTSERKASNALFVPVRTDWRDSKSLLGYYNPLTGTYEWTDFLRFLLRAVQSYRRRDGLAWFVILDEMNLARVEYYFADLLSVLESGRDAEGWTREPLRLPYPNDAEGDLPPSQIRVPPNLYVIGTVNVDETTHSFSPKVLDRAFTLELTEADFSQYPPSPAHEEGAEPSAQMPQAILANFTQGGRFVRIDKPAITAYVRENGEIRERLQMLNEQLRPYQLHFGYRIFDEIITFLISAQANDLYSSTDEAFDAAVLMKVLPKFHGSRGKLEDPLKRLLAWCLPPDAPAPEIIDEKLAQEQDPSAARQALEDLSYRYKRTAAKCRRMLWQLHTTGFASFS